MASWDSSTMIGLVIAAPWETTMTPRKRIWLSSTFVVLCHTGVVFLLKPPAATAQVVNGRVSDANTAGSVLNATVELLDDRGRFLSRTLTDSTGAFRLRAWISGKYFVRTTMLGYAVVTSDVLELGTGESIELSVPLTLDPVKLAPVTVRSRSRSTLTEIAVRGYYDRRDAGRRIGMGRFLDRGEIVQKGTKLSDVLRRIPGLRVFMSGPCVFISSGSNPTGTTRWNSATSTGVGKDCSTPPSNICPANVFLDGMPLKPSEVSLDQIVPLDWVEAIEVYRRAAELPAEFLSSGSCGVVAVWTRRG
jgi:hypothetical protein